MKEANAEKVKKKNDRIRVKKRKWKRARQSKCVMCVSFSSFLRMCLRTSGSRNINQLERAVIYSLIFAYSLYAITLKCLLFFLVVYFSVEVLFSYSRLFFSFFFLSCSVFFEANTLETKRTHSNRMKKSM